MKSARVNLHTCAVSEGDCADSFVAFCEPF